MAWLLDPKNNAGILRESDVGKRHVDGHIEVREKNMDLLNHVNHANLACVC